MVLYLFPSLSVLPSLSLAPSPALPFLSPPSPLTVEGGRGHTGARDEEPTSGDGGHGG